MKAVRPIIAAVVLTGLAGCTVGPDYHPPSTEMPPAFGADLSTTRPSSTTRPVDVTRWWRALDDPELDSLVDRTVTSNLDIDIALTRLQEARENEAVISGGSLPSLELSGAAARGTGTNSTKGRVSGPLNAGTDTSGLREITEVVGFDAGWEIDLFGRYRRQMEAAGDDAQAAAEARNEVLVTVISDVARAYLDARTLQLRLAIARQNIRNEQNSVDFVQARLKQGIANELDVALARRQLATVEATVAPLQAQIVQAQRRVAVLLGQWPDDLSQELQQPAALPVIPDTIEPGLPIDLLRRRPDIRLAERQLAGATARIGVATAQLFPRVAITGGFGLQGQGLGRTPNESSQIWSAGPAAYWPLLDFGTLDAAIQIQDLQTHEQLVNYRRTVLNAVEEVENAITQYSAMQDRLRNLGDALAASERAESLASQRYDRGLTDYLNVLDAQRQLYELQDQYASAQEDAVLQFIAIYKGLGGGWEGYQSIPPVHQPAPAIVAMFQHLQNGGDVR